LRKRLTEKAQRFFALGLFFVSDSILSSGWKLMGTFISACKPFICNNMVGILVAGGLDIIDQATGPAHFYVSSINFHLFEKRIATSLHSGDTLSVSAAI
jgi:hypothetical protein